MDKVFLFNMLVEKAKSHGDAKLENEDVKIFLDKGWDDDTIYVLDEINKRKELPLPEFDLHDEFTIENLRKEYKDNVAIISAILNIVRPDEYFFYNPLTFENELFEGVQYFADIVPEFEALDFGKVGKGKKRFDNYLKFNHSLFNLANRLWSDVKCPYYHINFLLYDCIGSLFIEHNDYRKYWIIATGKDYFEALDLKDELVWSGKKAMQAGDKIFVYRTSPVSAITDVFEAAQDSYFEQASSWDGFWVKMRRISKVPPIDFSDMRKDPVLSDWWVVKKQFTGTVADPVSFSVYNRFLELIPNDIKKKHKLASEAVAEHGNRNNWGQRTIGVRVTLNVLLWRNVRKGIES